jgi:hypothetical protein
MGQKLYSQDETGIKFSSERKPGEVRIPNYVYDIWLPILGSDALAIYAVYCRLEMKGAVKKIKLVDIARACRIGKGKLNKINDKLQDCGFVKINKPIGEARLMHWTTEVVVLDPPRKIAQKLIDKYAPNYQILTPWLLRDEDQIDPPEDPDRPSEQPEQAPPESPDKPPKIESLDSLQPLDVEEKNTPSDFGIGQADPLDGVPQATDSHQRAVDEASGGNGADPNQQVAEHLYWGFERGVVDLPPEKVWKKWYQGGKRLRERLPAAEVQHIARYIDDWFANKDSPEAFWQDNPLHDTALDVIARFIKNGGKHAPNNRIRRVPRNVPEYSVADPAAFGEQSPDDA